MDDNDKAGRSNLKKYRKYNPSSSNPFTRSQPPTATNNPVASTSFTKNSSRSVGTPQPGTPCLPTPVLPRITQRSDSGRSTPSTTSTSRSNPPWTVQPLPIINHGSAPAAPTPAPTLPTTGLRVRGAQTPISPPEQSGIFPLLAVIKDQQTAILTQNATFDLSLRDLVAELGKLGERVKQREDNTKKSEEKDKAKEEKEKGQLKALTLLAQGVDDVRKRVIGIENVIGVSGGQDGGDKTTILDRLQNIEMSVEEWLERARDPDAGIALDRRGSIRPPTPSSLSPSAVRHEMAVSPIKLSSTSQTVSTYTPEPPPTPKSTKVDVSTQVDASDEPPTHPTIAQEVTESGSLCVSCSNKLTPIKSVVTELHSMNDIEMSDSSASAPSRSNGKEVDRTPIQDSHQIIDDDPFLPQTDPLSTLASTAPATQTDLVTSDTASLETACERSDRQNEGSVNSRSGSPPEKLGVASFSPADWRKTPTSFASAAEETSLSGPSSTPVPSTVTPNQSKSYILPPLPEGTVAALRKEVLVVDPHPLESTGLGNGNNLVLTMADSVEAAQRMPSPESQCDEDNMDGDDVKTYTPIAGDAQRSESKRSSSPTPQPNAPAMTSLLEKSNESAPIPGRRIMAPVMQKRVSTPTESSLTTLSPEPSASSDEEEDSNIPRPPSPEEVQPSTSIAIITPCSLILPASQTSNITEDEDTVMTLVMDAQPTSPSARLPPPSQTAFSPLRLSASPLVLVSPEPGRTRSIDSSGNDDEPGDKESLMRLQEWYREQGAKALSKQENDITTARVEVDSITTTNQNEGGCVLEKDKPILDPGSPLFSSPDVSPHGPINPEGDHSMNQTDHAACNDGDNISGNHHSNGPPPISPLFTSPSITPRNAGGTVVPVHPEPPSYLKKLKEIVKDDDADIVPLKRGRAPSTTVEKEESIPSATQQQHPKLNLKAQNKRLSKAKTRIKKRKVSQEHTKIEVHSEDEEDQPPLKRVKLRVGKAPTPSGSGSRNTPTTTTTTPKKRTSASSSARKPKSVTVVSPVRTPRRRARDQQPRTASIVWPKIDKPVFDQFIECDICEQWYHVGCVGIHPDDIRLSASEIYRCPPCVAGVPNLLALTPVQNVPGDKQDEACARPKCLCPRRKRSQSIKTEGTFTVESFVGMVKKAVGGRGIKLVYLVKWQGYDFEDATWEEGATMGLPNPGFFVEQFEEQARKEGIDLSLCNSQASLLKCAVEAGWKPNGLFVRKET